MKKPKFGADYYRTCWLMAHNRLHDLVYKSKIVSRKEFNAYLRELKTAPEISARPA